MSRRDSRITDTADHPGMLITGASKMVVEGQKTSRVGDIYLCMAHGPNPVVTGAAKFIVEGQRTARIGDVCACGAVLASGASKLIIGT